MTLEQESNSVIDCWTDIDDCMGKIIMTQSVVDDISKYGLTCRLDTNPIAL